MTSAPLPVGRPAPRRRAPRWPAFAAIVVAFVAVVIVVFALGRTASPWATIGPRSVADDAPQEAAIGLFAVATGDGGVAVAGFSRGGTRRRCLPVEFEIDGRPSSTMPTPAERCRPDVIAGRGVRIGPGHVVRAYAAGKALGAIGPDELGDCAVDGNLCARLFDRHGEPLPIRTRGRDRGEVDRDDLLRTSLLRGGGRAAVGDDRDGPDGEGGTAESPDVGGDGAGRARQPQVERFGSVRAVAWQTTLLIPRGGATTAAALGALVTRRPDGFAVRVDYDGAPDYDGAADQG